MTIEEELSKWLITRPAWQQDVVGRMCRNETIDDADITKIVDDLIAGTPAVVTPVAVTDIPGNPVAAAGVRLLRVRDLRGVNDLAEGETLTFAEIGLTVVFGFNGSGKSGYARLLRRGVSARVAVDVLGNVFGAGTQPPQGARIDYAELTGGQGSWAWNSPPSAALGQVRFYDRECGQAYVTVASEISYRPSALVLLEWLVAACDRVAAELDSRLTANAAERPTLPLLPAGTSAATFLGSLNAQTTDEQIVAATSLPADFSEQAARLVSEFARLQASDPAGEKQRLAAIAGAYATVSARCRELSGLLGAAGLDAAISATETARNLREAADIASSRSFESEPLAGVGSQTWRELWLAARQYSEVEAYSDRPFPVAVEDEHCVLCQQTLEVDGAERLRRFDQFMVDTTEQQAAVAEREVAALRSRLEPAAEMPAVVRIALQQIDPADSALAARATQWLENTAGQARRLLVWMDNPETGLFEAIPTAPAAEMDNAAAAAKEQATLIDQASYTVAVERSRALVTEVRSTRALVDSVAEIRVEVGRLKARNQLQALRNGIETAAITREATLLTKAYVTQVVSDQFAKEADRLDLRRVTFAPSGGRKGMLIHKPGFVGATTPAPVQKVLSEGELTALGLAGFLTEVAFEPTRSAVVFDDPVTSLDHRIRESVAARLVELAAGRQVIVFTHDIFFVIDLKRIAEAESVPTFDQTIARRGEQPGFCSDTHPWTAQDVKTRVSTLETKLVALKKERSTLTDPEYEARAAEFAGELSETWERTVHVDVVSRVVDTGSGELRPKLFRLLARVTAEDNKEFQDCYGQASKWARRHDNNPGFIYVPPMTDALEKALKQLKDWRSRMNGYANKP
ncbi:AAA family ATPase [Kribbella sp. CA-294648]|uniref:AAA family ATPase n=1 Tax=Kribbella sp. CA-294648 TaxID=3239948 RepID=UPI003D92C1B9